MLGGLNEHYECILKRAAMNETHYGRKPMKRPHRADATLPSTKSAKRNYSSIRRSKGI